MAKLYRDRDGEGHYGSVVNALDPNEFDEDTGNFKAVGHEPMVGYMLFIGTVTGGMFSDRDWWRTTPITEILSDDGDVVRFRTRNSTYTFER
jgi:hypothetical protein